MIDMENHYLTSSPFPSLSSKQNLELTNKKRENKKEKEKLRHKSIQGK